MQTTQLIAALANDAPLPRERAGGRLRGLGGLALALAAVVIVALATMGLRAQLGLVLLSTPTAAKWLLPLLVAAAALPAALHLARPEAVALPGAARWLLAVLALAAVFGLALALASAPEGARWQIARGRSAPFCVVAIPVMALPMLAALIGGLYRWGASTRPAQCGAMAGLAAGGLAGAVYALHCIEDAPLFFLLWYGLGILANAGFGALAGRRWLSRW